MHELTDWTIRWRMSGHTSGAEQGIGRELWPIAIDAPAPPFALGKVIALVASDPAEPDSIAKAKTIAYLIVMAPQFLVLCRRALKCLFWLRKEHGVLTPGALELDLRKALEILDGVR